MSITVVWLVTIPFAHARFTPRSSNFELCRTIVKIALLATMAFVLIIGTAIYRPSPLQGSTLISAFIEAGAIFNLDHIPHPQIIAFRRYTSRIPVIPIAPHVCFAFKRLGPSGSFQFHACGLQVGNRSVDQSVKRIDQLAD